MTRINPFRPNSPVAPGMFVGRIDELQALEQSLVQTRAGQPKHFMLTGERGIGKTSLLNYLRWVAQGEIDGLDGEKFKFLVLDLATGASTDHSGIRCRNFNPVATLLGGTQRGSPPRSPSPRSVPW